MRRSAIAILVTAAVMAGAWWLARDYIRGHWPQVFRPASPHERYARSLEEADLHQTALGRAWRGAAAASLRDARPVTLPFDADASFDVTSPAAAGWRFRAIRGRRVEVDVESGAADARLFIDLFRAADSPPSLQTRGGERRPGEFRVASAADGARTLVYEPPVDETLILRVQPELLRGGRVRVRQRAVATLRFPLEGVTSRAVRSVFGDERDRGARSHEGVDIFAPRGTVAVAAADGWVTAVTTNRLGGKVVWVWDADRAQALYYAHLDRQDVAPGTRVREGEPIGRVGNTGNARETGVSSAFRDLPADRRRHRSASVHL